jgi:hypothetical protein
MKINKLINFGIENCLKTVAILVTISILFKSIIDVDKAWDTWNYHLPFAARIWGIVPTQLYSFEDGLEYRFDGFPLFGEFLQGFFWFISQHLQSANLVNLLSLVLYVYFLKNYFNIPLYLSAIALLAIPLVQIHATSCYVDLLGNLGVSTLIMMTYLLYTRQDVWSLCTKRNALIILVSAIAAANTKFPLIPIVFLILCFIGYRFIALCFQHKDLINLQPKQWFTILPAILLASILIFATPIKNTILLGNPFFPLKVEVANIVLNYKEDSPTNAPTYLKEAPQYQKWVHSILGISIFKEGKLRRWTIDQATVPNSPSDRMGGYCAVYVVLNLMLLGYIFYINKCRETWVAVISVLVMSAVTSIIPQSHYLRFYMYWMISLVSLNLYLVSRIDQLKAVERRVISTKNVGMATSFMLIVVIASTKAMYILPQFLTVEKYVKYNVNNNLLKEINQGDEVCFVKKQPKTFLYASIFHSPLNYSVKAADSVKECSRRKVIGIAK